MDFEVLVDLHIGEDFVFGVFEESAAEAAVERILSRGFLLQTIGEKKIVYPITSIERLIIRKAQKK